MLTLPFADRGRQKKKFSKKGSDPYPPKHLCVSSSFKPNICRRRSGLPSAITVLLRWRKNPKEIPSLGIWAGQTCGYVIYIEAFAPCPRLHWHQLLLSSHVSLLSHSRSVGRLSFVLTSSPHKAECNGLSVRLDYSWIAGTCGCVLLLEGKGKDWGFWVCVCVCNQEEEGEVAGGSQ